MLKSEGELTSLKKATKSAMSMSGLLWGTACAEESPISSHIVHPQGQHMFSCDIL